eukprot:XP_027304733.1 uncharacterized protein LOC101790118 isoform X4 [Anas platyrhynchos]
MGPRPPPAAQRVPLKDPPTTGTPSDALLLQRATGRPPPVPAAGRVPVEPNTLLAPQYLLQPTAVMNAVLLLLLSRRCSACSPRDHAPRAVFASKQRNGSNCL